MMRNKLLTAIWSVVLGCLLSLGSVLCMVTAFDLQVDVGVLVICCIGAVLLCVVCYLLPLGLLPAGIGAVILGFLWSDGSLKDSLEAILNRLTRQYHRAYKWEIIRWGFRTADEMEPTILLTLCILGALIAMATVWSVCRRKTALPALLLSLLCAGTCFVVTDTVPDIIWLYCLLLGIMVLLLTGRVRRQDEQQGNRLTLIAAPAAALALLVLLVAVPESTYNGQARAQRLAEFVFTDPRQLLMGKDRVVSGSGTSSVDLTTVGFRNTSSTPIMEVTAEFDDTLYLRSRAMNLYNGISWYDSSDYDGEILSWQMLEWPTYGHLTEAGYVQIATRYTHRMQYTPYYLSVQQMKDIPTGLVNDTEVTEYSFNCWRMRSDSYLASLYPSPLWESAEWRGDMLEQFIRLPDDVRKWAEPLADEITNGIVSPYHKAQAIADYVRSSARYDTQTPKMPGRQKDFVRWFLESSDTGYCIHFASATAVLLQASGIPARYVTGYTAQVAAGETTVVTADQAHAWVEYFIPGFGWAVLESTPAADEPILTQPQDTTQATEDDGNPMDEETSPTRDSVGVNEKKGGNVILTVLIVVAVLAAAVVAAWGQYRLRRYWQKRRFRRCTPNAQTILRWQEAVRLAALLGETPDPELFDLAQKARFSQHTITDSELARFEAYAAAAKEELQNRPLLQRFYYRIILAVY